MDCCEDHWLDKPEVDFLKLELSIRYHNMMACRGASLNQLKPVRAIMDERKRKIFYTGLCVNGYKRFHTTALTCDGIKAYYNCDG